MLLLFILFLLIGDRITFDIVWEGNMLQTIQLTYETWQGELLSNIQSPLDDQKGDMLWYGQLGREHAIEYCIVPG